MARKFESALTAGETARVTTSLKSAVSQNDLFQGMNVESIKLENVGWFDHANHRELLVSAVVSFASASNRYCSAAVIDGALAAARLIEGPPAAQNCLRMGRSAFVDVNGDGPAIVQEIIVASNRDGADAPIFAVYLPSADGDGYCYSSQAGDRLYGINSFASRALKLRLDAEKARLRLARFECGN